jgi:pimeloyl-ACP methyl ester carboxylesterase
VIAAARVAAPQSAVSPSEKTPLIFVHGVGSTAAIWDYQLRDFGRDRLCAAIELRGNGASKPDPNPATITREGFAQDVLAVADALRAPQFVIVGCSLGGVVAFELWRSAPQRIAAMLVLGSFARYPDGRQVADRISGEARAAGSMRAYGELRAAKLGLPPDRLYETVEQFACKSLDCFVASTQATWTGDYLGLLPSVDVPVLVAYGEHDVVAPRALAEEIASGISGSELVTIPAAGHVANADNPNAFNELMRSWNPITG